MKPLPDDRPLPRLREELRLEAAAASDSGAPRWRFHDPLRHRNFLIGADDVRLLSLWSCGTVGRMRAAVAGTEGLLDESRLKGLLDFLVTHHLVQPQPDGGSRALLDAARRARPTGPSWLLQRYLGMRFALWRPQAFLDTTLPLFRSWCKAPLIGTWAALTSIGLWLVARQWDAFVGTFAGFVSLGGALGYGVALVALKIVHELGHAYAAAWHRCRVGSMGISVVMGMPMLYTETSDASRLPAARSRMWIAAAGVLAESLVAGLATFAWGVLPDGSARGIAFVIATSSWLMTVAINLNPLSRFDGYYFLGDALRIENLQPRALAFASWATGRALFGPIETPPEATTPRRAAFLIAFGCAVWVYRIGLYVGMAVLAYTCLFKLAGVLVMAFELWTFVARPSWRKASQWWAARDHVTRRRRGILWLCCAGICLLLIVPLDRSVTAPAMLTWQREAVLEAPENARVVDVLVVPGQRVRAGQLLLRLDSPELRLKQRSASIHRASADQRLDRISGDARDRDASTVLAQQRNEAEADLQGLANREALLDLRAPADGVVVDLPIHLQAGVWVRPDTTLVRVLSGSERDARGFVDERDVARLRSGARAHFIADDAARPSLPMRLVDIDLNAAEQITLAPLSSLHGGRIATQQDVGREVPVTAQHRVRFACEGCGQTVAALPTSLRGEVRIDAEPQSLAGQAGRRLWRLLVEELRG